MFNKKPLRVAIISAIISVVMVFAPTKTYGQNIQNKIVTNRDGQIMFNLKAPESSVEAKNTTIAPDRVVEHEQIIKFVDMEITLSAVPNESPNAGSINIIRKINGVVDDTFQWNGGISNWYETEKILEIYNIKYVDGAEYEVTFTDQEDITILDVKVVIKEINLQDIAIETLNFNRVVHLEVKLSKVPEARDDLYSYNIVRKVNGVVDESFKWNGGASSWNDIDKILKVYNVAYVDGAEYEVTYPEGHDIQVVECNVDNQNKEMVYGYFNSNVPIELDSSWFSINRYVNGELDNSFNAEGVYIDNYYNYFAIEDLFTLEPGDYDKVIKYAVAFNNSEYVFSNEIIIKGKNLEHKDKLDIELLYPIEGFEGFVIGGDARVEIRATNKTNADKKCTLIIGLYDKNNRLISYTSATQTVRTNDSTELLCKLKVLENGYKLKAFVWNDFQNMKPLSEVLEIPIIK